MEYGFSRILTWAFMGSELRERTYLFHALFLHIRSTYVLKDNQQLMSNNVCWTSWHYQIWTLTLKDPLVSWLHINCHSFWSCNVSNEEIITWREILGSYLLSILHACWNPICCFKAWHSLLWKTPLITAAHRLSHSLLWALQPELFKRSCASKLPGDPVTR